MELKKSAFCALCAPQIERRTMVKEENLTERETRAVREERRTMTEEQLKAIYQLYAALWKLFKTYCDAWTDTQWEQCTDQAAKIVDQHGEDVRPLVIDTLELLERRRK